MGGGNAQKSAMARQRNMEKANTKVGFHTFLVMDMKLVLMTLI